MTAAETLAEIVGRAEAATAGPWEFEVEPDELAVFDVQTGCDFVFVPDPMSGHKGRLPNATFIAASRTDVPRMAAALGAVLALADEYEQAELADLRNHHADEIRTAISAALAGEAGA